MDGRRGIDRHGFSFNGHECIDDGGGSVLPLMDIKHDGCFVRVGQLGPLFIGSIRFVWRYLAEGVLRTCYGQKNLMIQFVTPALRREIGERRVSIFWVLWNLPFHNRRPLRRAHQIKDGSSDMTKNACTTSDTTTFQPGDLLVSRTDERGVILAANEAFERISGFSHEELIVAPHKIVRHEHMPKGAFFLVWEALKSGASIGAIVKNRTKDGEHYWVFAFLVPQPGGYASIRVKPSPELIELMEGEYQAVCEFEQNDEVSPADSAEHLRERIMARGYPDYENFMTEVAIAQARLRAGSLQSDVDEKVEYIAGLTSLWTEVQSDCDDMAEAHRRISHTPTNLRVQAAHLNERGIPLSVIATNFTVLASEIEEMMAQFLSQAETVNRRLNRAAFLVATEYFMSEARDAISIEVDTNSDMDAEMGDSILAEWGNCTAIMLSALADTRQETMAFSSVLDETSRVLSGLSVAKVMCEIENAYVGPDRNSGVTDIISELDRFQTQARECMFSIRRRLMRVEQTMKRLLAEQTASAAA